MTRPPSEFEAHLMRQALSLAAQARGMVEPNPMVGCIIHRDGKVLGQGYHRRFGAPHAEPEALAQCQQRPEGAAAVVTLEPCCHQNKKTPPCVPALIAAGLRRIVVGQMDPNPAVAGQGIAQLRAAGIDVHVGLLQAECQQLNAPFFAFMKLRRPYITLKWAESSNGLIGGPGRTPRAISGEQSKLLVHQLRTRCDAIAVSADTVICDNPQLTVREVPILRIPRRVIFDTHLRTPAGAGVLSLQPPPLIYSTVQRELPPAEVVTVSEKAGHLKLGEVLAHLRELGVTHLLIEPGERLARALLDQGLWDRAWVFRSPLPIEQSGCPRAPRISQTPTGTRQVGQDVLCEYLNPASAAYFANLPSPEFSLPIQRA